MNVYNKVEQINFMNKDLFVPITFTNTDKNQYYLTLRKRINQYFKEKDISRHANFAMRLKTVILIAAYVVPYLLIVTLNVPVWGAFGLLTIMALAYAGLGMSVMHDANHGAYSQKNKVNNLIGYVLNLIGGSKYNWKIQHNILHHTYTNVYGVDEDIENGGLFRLSPYSEVKWFHKYQHIYSWFLYALGTLFWVTTKDFTQIARIKKKGIKFHKDDNLSKEIAILILFKLIYYGYIFAVPLIFTSYSVLDVLIGFIYLHAITGFVLGVTFQLAHVVETTEHENKEETNKIDKSWAAHQMYTTANFARKSKVLNWYLGGLNFQVEHHLFPNICHVYYNKISSIVKQTAKEFNLPYYENKTMVSAIRSHYKMLKAFRTGQGSVEELRKVA